MKAFRLLLVISVMAISATAAFAGLPVTNAYDDADDPAYAPPPDHDYSIDNGGFGYGLWTTVTSAGGGGTYMEGPGVNSRGVPTTAEFSFALFGSTFALSRPLTSSIVSGEFDIFSRFDLAGIGPNLINIRSGNNTNGFGNGELLSFGIVN